MGAREDGQRMRVLILTPLEGDAQAVAQVLRGGGFEPYECVDMEALAEQIGREPGAVVVAQEALTGVQGGGPERTAGLAAALRAQPEWSDLPIILLAAPGSGEERSWRIARGLDPVGNITILQRPLGRTTLLNAVTVALRARVRQYQLRLLLGAHASAKDQLARYSTELERTVAQRTAELAASNASLHAAERLAALGTLAAGLGHDIANLTLPIRARLASLDTAAASEETRGDLEGISRALDHLSNLSAGMRLMAMDPAREAASNAASDLSEWCEQTSPVLRAALPRHVRLECECAAGLGAAIPRHRLAQAVFNLVQNAAEAMAQQDGGVVRVTAGPGPSAEYVRMTVSDNGPGMTPAVLARCFEPYFSTKGRAIATGMGLSMVRGIIESVGGEITVDTVLGAGTTFTLMLPASGSAAAAAPLRGGTAALTIGSPRTASIVRMLLEGSGVAMHPHPACGVPTAGLWVVDTVHAGLAGEFLAADPRAKVVLLGTPEPGAGLHPVFTRGPDAPRWACVSEPSDLSALRNAIRAVS